MDGPIESPSPSTETTSPGAEVPATPPGKPRRRRRWLRVLRSSGINLGLAIVLLVAIGLVAIRTALGNDLVVRGGIALADGRVAGEIRVGDVRSANLLRGALVSDLLLLTPEGDTLLSADSLEVGYRVRDLITGNIVLSGLRLWGAEARIESTLADPEEVDSGSGPSTLARWIGVRSDSTEAGEEAPSDRALTLGPIEILDSRFVLLRPLPGEPGGVLNTQGDGSERRLDLDVALRRAEVERIEILPSGRGGTTVEIGALEGTVDILREPVELHDAGVEVRISSRRLVVDVDRFETDLASASGTVSVGLGPIPDVQLQLELEGAELERIRWISDRIPPVRGDVELQGRVAQGGSRWTATNADLSWGAGAVGGRGTVILGDGVILEEVDTRLTSLPPGVLRDYLPAELGLPEGALSGRVAVEGPVERLSVTSRVTLRGDGPETTADFSGILEPRPEGIRFTDTRVELLPLQWSDLSAVVPAVNLGGSGAVRARLSGSVDEGLLVDAEVRHERPGLPPSRVVARGSVLRDDEEVWRIDLQGDASPLSLAALQLDRPDLPIGGELRGSFRTRGRLDDLTIETRVSADVGVAELELRLNPARWSDGVRLAGTLDDFRAGKVWTALGERTSLSGEVEVTVAGDRIEALTGTGRARLGPSRVNGLPIDSALVAARVGQGRLRVDSLRGRLGGVDVEGTGTLATDSAEAGGGEVQLSFRTASLAGLRPAFLGDTVIARDTLRALERDALVLRGIDPDTLPLLDEVRLEGAVEGTVTLSGAVTDFTADARLEGRDLVWARNTVGHAEATVRASGLPATDARIDFDLITDTAEVATRLFERSRFTGSYAHPSGEVEASIQSGAGESIDLRTGLTLSDGGLRAEIASLDLAVEDAHYLLQQPTTLVWTDSMRSVEGLDLIRDGDAPVRIRADGRLPWEGETDFTLDVERLEVVRLLRILQREDLPISGIVDGRLRITGAADAPEIEAEVVGDDVRWEAARFDHVEGELDYRARRAVVAFDADRRGERVLHADGIVPIDLALGRTPPRRFLDEELELTIFTDSLAARSVLGWLEDLEQIEGAVTGQVEVTGTVDDPVASGRLALTGGAWTLGSVGVRQRGVGGTAVIGRDGIVQVEATAEAGRGRASATGTVTLSSLLDPEFDLTMRLDEFQAVDRLDVSGAVSGDLQLTGRYRQPVLTGNLEVDEGTLYLDEFQRSIGVLDLGDPRFAAIIDTTDIGGRALLERTQNPFMDALRMDISMDVESNTWLRGRTLQVEIVGEDIIVVYDRQRRDLSLLGDLTVVRGQAFQGSRVFEVETGTVSFEGLAGINPSMDIVAETRIRRQDGDPLDITVNLGGTLLNPSFDLSTDEQGLSDSDLLSYIAFGQPTSSLTGAGSGNLAANAFGAAGNWLSGTVANQLAALAAQELSLIDYLAITQVGDLGFAGGGTGVGASFASTQVEIGRYFSGGEIFGAVVLRPLSQLGGSAAVVGGARMEWQSSDAYHLEAFIEDRFLRTSAFGLSEVQLGAEYVIGFAVVREWGY